MFSGPRGVTGLDSGTLYHDEALTVPREKKAVYKIFNQHAQTYNTKIRKYTYVTVGEPVPKAKGEEIAFLPKTGSSSPRTSKALKKELEENKEDFDFEETKVRPTADLQEGEKVDQRAIPATTEKFDPKNIQTQKSDGTDSTPLNGTSNDQPLNSGEAAASLQDEEEVILSSSVIGEDHALNIIALSTIRSVGVIAEEEAIASTTVLPIPEEDISEDSEVTTIPSSVPITSSSIIVK